jgi:hypothetical protein
VRVYEPTTTTPAPTPVFNHGSTGTGTNPDAFARPLDFPEVVRFFVARGWTVVIPARRGRGGSEGQYDEGFWPNRSWGCACDTVVSIAGTDRALRDVEAAMNTIVAMPFVDRARVVIGGQSRLFTRAQSRELRHLSVRRRLGHVSRAAARSWRTLPLETAGSLDAARRELLEASRPANREAVAFAGGVSR